MLHCSVNPCSEEAVVVLAGFSLCERCLMYLRDIAGRELTATGGFDLLDRPQKLLDFLENCYFLDMEYEGWEPSDGTVLTVERVIETAFEFAREMSPGDDWEEFFIKRLDLVAQNATPD